jgi:hypothetical protein
MENEILFTKFNKIKNKTKTKRKEDFFNVI